MNPSLTLTPRNDGPSSATLGLAAAVVVCFMVIVRCAWVCDDAYITARTVDNLVHGHGLTWTPGERVQAFTHPLWMWLLAVTYALSHDAYLTLIGLGLASSAGFLAALVRFNRRSESAMMLALTALLMSKAFIDFSTSGLENPLTHLLLVPFFAVAWALPSAPPRLGLLTLLAALIVLNRPDTALVVAPTLVVATWRYGKKHRPSSILRHWLLGGSPLVGWCLFATWYYGTPIPNTAYAKLSTGISMAARMAQGCIYLLDSLARDPVTLSVTALALLAVAIWRLRHLAAAALGIVLYLAYVVWIGGDFMSGRFLTPPFVVAVLILSRLPATSWKSVVLPAVVLVVLGLASPEAPIRSDRSYGADQAQREAFRKKTGIADERRFYFQDTGLIRQSRKREHSSHPWAQQGRRWRRDFEAGKPVENPVVRDAIGFFGFAAGPHAHIIDPIGLVDPLIARLPIESGKQWRVGHYHRHLPTGFLESQLHQDNLIADPDLAIYYDALRTVTRGELWSWSRLEVLAALSWGRYDQHLEAYVKRRRELRDSEGPSTSIH